MHTQQHRVPYPTHGLTYSLTVATHINALTLPSSPSHLSQESLSHIQGHTQYFSYTYSLFFFYMHSPHYSLILTHGVHLSKHTEF